MAYKSRNALGRRIVRRWQLYVLLALPLAVVFIFNYMPMVGLVIAFKKYNFRDGIFGSPWVGFKQFEKFFRSAYFGITLKNTLTLSFYTLATFPSAIIFALLLNAMRGQKYKKVIQTITYVPHFISTVVMVGLIFTLLNYRTGIYGSIGNILLGGNYPPDFMADGRNFKHVYVWSGVWQNLGYNSVLYIAALAGIDPTQHEAATIDGATRFQRIIHVDLPGILPTVSIMLILAVGNIMNVGYEKTYLMQNDLNLKYSEIISTYVYKVGLTGIPDFSYGTAISLFNSVINFILVILANTISNKVSGNGIF